MKLPVIDAFHSGDISLDCPRRVLLKRSGLWSPDMPGAMFKGLFFGMILERWHNAAIFDGSNLADICADAATTLTSENERDERMLTEATEKNIATHTKEVMERVVMYIERFGERFAEVSLYGTELPIRFYFKKYGQTWKFESHLDILFLDTNNVFGRGEGVLHLWDWKYWDAGPTLDYLTRNYQMILYQLASCYGEVWMNGSWTKLNVWCDLSLMWAGGLKPYGKAITTRDDLGNETTYKKGDKRPEKACLYHCNFRVSRRDAMIDRLLELPRMMRAGFYPPLPSKIGCFTCESKDWCDRFDLEDIELNNSDPSETTEAE